MNGINKGTIHVAFNAFSPAIEDAQALMRPRDDFLTPIYHSFVLMQ